MPDEKKKLFQRAGAVVLVLLVILGIASYRHFSHYESTDDAFIDAHIIPISPKVAGQVLAVHVTDNQQIKAGDPLLEIDPRDYEAKVAEHRGKTDAAEVEARRAAADAQRYEKIYKQDEISQQQLDNAEAAAVSAKATYEREKGALEQEQLNLSYTKMVAPESGQVTNKSVEPGAYLQVGQTLFAIVPENVWVTANFKETQLTHMQPGQKVTVKVDAYPDRTFEGHVDSIQSGTGQRFSVLPAENATGNYVKVVQRIPVKILLNTPPDPNFHLAPGMSVVPTVRVD